MALGTMPCSNEMFIIMESGTLHGSHSCHHLYFFLALHTFNIVFSGPSFQWAQFSVGVKYSDDGLGLLPK